MKTIWRHGEPRSDEVIEAIRLALKEIEIAKAGETRLKVVKEE
jgi:hypothetical protein